MENKTDMTREKSLDEELQELHEKEAIFLLRALVLTGKISASQMMTGIELARSVISRD